MSVIVPVYNPGTNIDDCIESLLGQSLPPEEYEVIFVDDGSTDETPARLDALAAEHEHVRVTHIPNSGWPGKPRNVGIEMARGEYVYFVDNDDWIGRDALQRMYKRALRDEADIVIGKVVGEGKFVARSVFKRDRSDVTLEWPPLVRLLTPHKLFRKALLDEHGIRFPEGRRRLEDHVFVMHAYFHAQGISILTAYPCYHWVMREDAENASYSELEPAGYYANVREVLDLIDEHMEPGPLRDRLRSHWYRGKMLGRVGGRNFLERDPALKRPLYQEIRTLALERFGEEVHEYLAFNARVRSRLLRTDDYEGLEALAAFEAGLRTEAALVELEPEEEQALTLAIEARIFAAGGPLLFERDGERVRWTPPAPLAATLAPHELDVTDVLDRAYADVLIRSPHDGTEYLLRTETETRLEPASDGDRVTPVLTARARLEPRVAVAKAKLRRGEWTVAITASVGGFTPPVVEAEHGRWPLRVPLVVTITTDGRVLPPTPRGDAARRFPGVARLVRRARSAAAG
ncbi:MAG TPA: glycosyltransferase family 2 protein [Solirubrobacteraceae bacterium]|nr:glycosyltransferase family 2 protein [Solirubrobacteraceae bacterium]